MSVAPRHCPEAEVLEAFRSRTLAGPKRMEVMHRWVACRGCETGVCGKRLGTRRRTPALRRVQIVAGVLVFVAVLSELIVTKSGQKAVNRKSTLRNSSPPS